MILGIIALVFLDLLTKWLARAYLATPHEIVPHILKFSLSYNTGVAFSIPIPNVVMVIITPVFIALLVWLIIKNCRAEDATTRISLMLIVAGGLGNFINRLWTGAVIDFINFSFWPSFNLADAYLTIGAFLIVVFYGKINRRNN